MKKILMVIISIALIIFGYMYYINSSNETIEVLSKYGSRGDEVRQIQQKLKNWGYYKGNVDGIYGSQTQAAVKKFQKANGLSQDRNCRTKYISCDGNKFVWKFFWAEVVIHQT